MPKLRPKNRRKYQLRLKPKHHISVLAILLIVGGLIISGILVAKMSTLEGYKAKPFLAIKPLEKIDPKAAIYTSPSSMKSYYGLSGQGSGTIAIIDAYDNPSIESDLATFSAKYGLPACTTANLCFEKHKMNSSINSNPDWAIEIALDVEWAHAIAPGAKILLVEAKSNSGNDLLDAINYASSRSDVRAISMSWGGGEFSDETRYEQNFKNAYGANYFASSGDSGNGTNWPSVSANVISVGGTSLNYNTRAVIVSESAWSGSGGGLSRYIKQPSRQASARVPQSKGYRATPDVSYNADPNSGYPVYTDFNYYGYKGWFVVGGTSAGAPQWAAISTISGSTFSNDKLYSDFSKTNQLYFKDITIGKNGNCVFYCRAQAGFDYVTGMGSPLTTSY